MKTLEEIKERIIQSKNPLILFDDDADGTCSFTLIYRFLQRGNGVIVKSSPEVKIDPYISKVREYGPDLIIILDKPKIQDEFLEEVNCDVVWIDHHQVQKKLNKNLFYYNPSEKGLTSTSAICWEIVKNKSPNDVWIAFTGAIGDWNYSEKLKKEFLRKFPNLINKEYKTAPEILFKTSIGKLVKVIAFNLKGKLGDVKKSFRIFTRMESPEEILNCTTPAGKYLYERYKKINKHYEVLRDKALNAATSDLFLISMVAQPNYSFSSELSNEILFNYPDKIIVIGRFNGGFAKCSIRTAFDIDLRPIIEVATEGIGYGGGHAKACGGCIEEDNFNQFLDKLREGVEEALKN